MRSKFQCDSIGGRPVVNWELYQQVSLWWRCRPLFLLIVFHVLFAVIDSELRRALVLMVISKLYHFVRSTLQTSILSEPHHVLAPRFLKFRVPTQ